MVVPDVIAQKMMKIIDERVDAYIVGHNLSYSDIYESKYKKEKTGYKITIRQPKKHSIIRMRFVFATRLIHIKFQEYEIGFCAHSMAAEPIKRFVDFDYWRAQKNGIGSRDVRLYVQISQLAEVLTKIDQIRNGEI
jgi:hypothetical protein